MITVYEIFGLPQDQVMGGVCYIPAKQMHTAVHYTHLLERLKNRSATIT